MKSSFSIVAKLLWLYFCAPKTKTTSQVRIKPEFLSTLGPNPIQNAQPNLQLRFQLEYDLASDIRGLRERLRISKLN